MASTNFRDFYNDDNNVSPTERAKIEFEVELIGKLIEAREAKGLTQGQLAEAAGLKQSAFEDIEIVWSHPQSLSQCAQYIADHGFDSVPFSNTAIAARDVAKEKRLNVAAICSYKACEEYGLKVLDNHLQDNDENTTRFIVISKKLYIPEDANRISLCFSLPHVTGSLYSLLCRFNSLGLNLTKIESRPRQGRQFEYLFYLDFSGNVRSENVIELVSQLSEEMPEFSFLGNYAEPEFPIK